MKLSTETLDSVFVCMYVMYVFVSMSECVRLKQNEKWWQEKWKATVSEHMHICTHTPKFNYSKFNNYINQARSIKVACAPRFLFILQIESAEKGASSMPFTIN